MYLGVGQSSVDQLLGWNSMKDITEGAESNNKDFLGLVHNGLQILTFF